MKTLLLVVLMATAAMANAQITGEICKTTTLGYGVGKISNETCINSKKEVSNRTCISAGVEAGGKIMGVGVTHGVEAKVCSDFKKEKPAREPREARAPVEKPVREPREPREPRERPGKD